LQVSEPDPMVSCRQPAGLFHAVGTTGPALLLLRESCCSWRRVGRSTSVWKASGNAFFLIDSRVVGRAYNTSRKTAIQEAITRGNGRAGGRPAPGCNACIGRCRWAGARCGGSRGLAALPFRRCPGAGHAGPWHASPTRAWDWLLCRDRHELGSGTVPRSG
jgi:hypothetical protein